MDGDALTVMNLGQYYCCVMLKLRLTGCVMLKLRLTGK
jgi:hypothetical protein